MQCQYCGDTEGPFETFIGNEKKWLVCETCGTALNEFKRLENMANRKDKKDETANICNKRYANRVSCSDRRR